MDGVPVFNLVRETMPAGQDQGFRGVVDSTTNHFLTALEDGDHLRRARARCRAQGIAEADPSLDVDGLDAASKVAALANVLLGGGVTPHDVDRTVPVADRHSPPREARARGCRVPGSSHRRGAAAGRWFKPVELPQDDLLAGLRGMANALILDTDTLGRVVISVSSTAV